MIIPRLGIVVAVLALQGCAAIQDFRQNRVLLMNPQRLNETGAPSDIAVRALGAQEVMVNNYYAAMRLAQTDYTTVPVRRASDRAVSDYVNEGVALNVAYCRRWFHRIDDTARRYDMGTRDLNIISALGTTALGLLEASAKTVAVYGAGLTAVAGFGENFNASLLTAPSARNVENRVMTLMADYGNQLRVEAQGAMPFTEAFTRLEAHADLCTFSAIRDVVNSSLTTTVSTSTRSGTISTVAVPAPPPVVITVPTVTSAFVADNSGDRVIAYWIPGNVVNQNNQDKLLAWMNKNGVNVSIPFFAHAKLYEAARKQAVAELAIPEVTK